ncbi:hypothetical protein MOE82_04420 [Bacillus licheniformis]|uniref:hypothetical protein n=1 Tax=Bacillus licheniformis TaxID=1402 RepID=UPI0021BD0F40|nr:hypothetical protein [Bacillus licheniformis]MCY7776278.1 hypothetical protein [Bacillus licheniformis]MCY7954383.1 hypothetical protein [Bacillus licheniformis]MCY8022347.1 hypothetical protein [Bacillus licheniformis]MCY8158817.1 hypothetical protein [Bacillus licheniformis]MCY8527622.1 hypothetical protein [Bacillus licheniformis]
MKSKKKRFSQGVITLTATTLIISGFSGFASSVSAAEQEQSTTSITETTDVTLPASLQEYMETHQEPTTLEDSKAFIQFASQTPEFQTYNQLNQDGQVHTAGLIGGSLKAIKAFGWVCRVGGKTLKWAIRPLSPSKARLVDKYARKIAYATERLNSASKGALVKALVKAGVPKKTADSLAEIILWLV